MQIDWNKIKIKLFIWYAWMMVQLKTAWEYIIFWSGLYLPLFVVNMVVRESGKREMKAEDDDFEEFRLEFFRIEYQIPYKSGGVNTKLRYDITSRMLWFLHFVGDNYGDLKDYVPRAVPWGDIHSHNMYNHGDAEVVFNYHVSKLGEDDKGKKYYEPVHAVRLRVKFNDHFYWNTYDQLKEVKAERYLNEKHTPPEVRDVMFNTLKFLEPTEPDSDSE
jgi:hypothetical protein